jgi:hypothetical protein
MNYESISHMLNFFKQNWKNSTCIEGTELPRAQENITKWKGTAADYITIFIVTGRPNGENHLYTGSLKGCQGSTHAVLSLTALCMLTMRII